MTDDIPDRLRTLAAEPGESPLVKAFGAWTPLEPETVPTDDDRQRVRAHLDRGLTPRPEGRGQHWVDEWWEWRGKPWRAWFDDETQDPENRRENVR